MTVGEKYLSEKFFLHVGKSITTKVLVDDCVATGRQDKELTDHGAIEESSLDVDTRVQVVSERWTIQKAHPRKEQNHRPASELQTHHFRNAC